MDYLRASRRRPSVSFSNRRYSHSHGSRRGESTDTRRSSFMSTVSGSGESTEWEEEAEEWEGDDEGSMAKRRKNEPMSPIAVVGYVIGFYLAFQILTRSDETEIFDVGSAHHSTSSQSMMDMSRYHMPYHLPQISSPIPAESPSSTPYWRMFLGVLVYPLYMVFNAISISLPLFANTLSLLMRVTGILLSPTTFFARSFFRTFVAYPLSVLKQILDVFSPVIGFALVVLAISCLIGGVAGWLGSTLLRWYIAWKNGGKKLGVKKRSTSSPLKRPTQAGIDYESLRRGSRPRVASSTRVTTAKRRPSSPSSSSSSTERPNLRSAYIEKNPFLERGQYPRMGPVRDVEGRGTAREPVIIGVRKRGRRSDLGY